MDLVYCIVEWVVIFIVYMGLGFLIQTVLNKYDEKPLDYKYYDGRDVTKR